MPTTRPTTRLAPSPTGALHLGNARTFLVNWALARKQNWRILLRIEDLDTPRIKPGVNQQTIDILRWLGIDWDDGPIIQSHDLEPYRQAMHALAARALAYPSALTRTQIQSHADEAALAALAASAPQEGAHEFPFPASLRPAIPAGGQPFDNQGINWRLLVPDRTITFTDQFAGPQSHNPARTVGDFLVWTMRAQPSYQLAVVVDDARQGVTHIVRGDDLLDSAARQILLYESLNLGPTPTYYHLPLVRGHDGKRLAKRHGDTRLDMYKSRGVTPQRVIGLIAKWCGITPAHRDPTPLSAAEFKAAVSIHTIPHPGVVFTPEDDRWLCE